MTEENKEGMPEGEQKEEYVPYANRLDKTKTEARNAFKRSRIDKFKKRVALSEAQIQWCEDTIQLMNNPAFKRYLDLESLMIGERLRNAYQPSPQAPEGLSYGENMAFNHGQHVGLLAVPAESMRLWKLYVDMKEQQAKENSNENENNH